MQPYDVYSLGFSNRSWDATLDILHAFGIRCVVDIRTLPGSRHTPQFNKSVLETALPRENLEYIHLKPLGGLRKPKRNDATNEGWKNAGFRGYADYMQTEEFSRALDDLIRITSDKPCVYACTEAVFWRCHRALVSDALTVRGYTVGHIFSSTKCELHSLTRFARVEGSRITYPVLTTKPPAAKRLFE
jgi:uncharacterized protein (DUF488 family)